MTGRRLDPEYWDHMDGMGAGWWWWGLISMVVLLLLVVGITVLVARSLANPSGTPGGGGVAGGSGGHPHDRAKALLAERYARGEIDTQEYRERLSELS